METNRASVLKVIGKDEAFYTESWRIQVGDTIKILEEVDVPADVVIIGSSEDRGNCYIQTSSLDGEKNLKKRETP